MFENMLTLLKDYFWKIIVSFIIILVGFGIGLFAKKLSLKILKQIELNRILSKVGIRNNVEIIISSVLSYLIYLITIVFALQELGITSIVLYLVLGAVLMLIVLSFLVGVKDIIPNFIAWLIIQSKSKVKVGKKIEIKEISGTVEKIGYLETEIKTERGDILYVPNRLFIKSKLKVKKTN